MPSLSLALLTVLPAGCTLVAEAAARLSTPVAAPALTLPAPAPVLALPAPRGPSALLAAIEEHRSANLAMGQAVRDYVEAESAGSPDVAHLLAVADRASDAETAAYITLTALTPTDAEEARTLTAYFAEVSAELDREAFGTQLLQRLSIMLANAKAA